MISNDLFPWMAIAGGLLLLGGAALGYFSARRVDRLLRRAEPRSRDNRTEGERLRSIYKLTTAMINTLNYERVLEIALDMSMSAFADTEDAQEVLICAALLFSDDRLIVQSARRFTNADKRQVFPCKEGALVRTVQRGEPTLVMEPAADPELGRVLALANCASAFLVPLRNGLDVYGVLLFSHPRPGFFDTNQREILEIIAAQAISAMQNAQLYNALTQEKERMTEAQDAARRKLARDLHDGPTQSVSAIAMRINFARRLLERDTAEASEELYKIEALARKTTQEIRHMLFTLRPLVLENQGLKAALEAMAEKVNETYNQNVIVEVDENTVAVLDMGRLGVIFYIVEEGINNARKHARADHIWVRLFSASSEIGLLEIEDDGVGFDVHSVNLFYDRRGSLGLFTLRERAELINGIVQIDSRPGKGTKIQVYIPLSEEGAEKLLQGPG